MGLKTFAARLVPVLLCAMGLGGLAAVLSAQVTAASVQLGLFGAYVNPDGPGAWLHWETENEYDTYGFNIYRSEQAGSHGTKLNALPIPGCGGCAAGDAYTYDDETAQPGVPYYYWLANVDTGLVEDAFYETTANCECDRPLILPGEATATPTPTWTPVPPTNTPPQPTDTVPAGQPSSTPAPTRTWTPTPTATTATANSTVTSTAQATIIPATATTPPTAPATTAAPPPAATALPTKETPGAPTAPAPKNGTPAGAPTLSVAGTAVAAASPVVATGAAGTGKPTAAGPAAQTRTSPTPRANATASGPRPTRIAPGDGSGGGLQAQGLILIGAAVLGLAVLGAVGWRMLRPPVRPNGPGGPQA